MFTSLGRGPTHYDLIVIGSVPGGLVARALPNIASHFVNTQFEHFDADDAALSWLIAVPVPDSPSENREKLA